ncbi:MAG TPA: flagellar basal body-associated FliL family protein [Opitutaceae bacterium]|nr:flagellar basal body-associated FliL family protein [Opitutaceae bacterium]
MAAAKTETPAAPAKADPAAKGETAPPVAPAAPAARGGIAAWLPAIAVVLLAPAVTWATVEFVLIPRLQKQLSTPVAEAAPESGGGHGGGHGKEGKEGKDSGTPNYEFQNIVVNLNGTMGTRYLKTSFMVTGEAGIKAAFEGNKPRLTDVTLNVLSSLTLADLEEPGAKNVIREKLVGAYNQALGRKVAEQVYFSDFVIQ